MVAGIDSLRTVADEKILVEFESGAFLKKRHAKFFSRARIHRRFVDDRVAFFDNTADQVMLAFRNGVSTAGGCHRRSESAP